MLTDEQAARALRGYRTVAVATGTIRNIKELHGACLARGIPAGMARPCSGGGG